MQSRYCKPTKRRPFASRARAREKTSLPPRGQVTSPARLAPVPGWKHIFARAKLEKSDFERMGRKLFSPTQAIAEDVYRPHTRIAGAHQRDHAVTLSAQGCQLDKSY